MVYLCSYWCSVTLNLQGIKGDVGPTGSKGQKGELGEEGPQGFNVSFLIDNVLLISYNTFLVLVECLKHNY